jgi:hypothetical protein
MKIVVDQKILICNLRYVKSCDHIYSYTDWLDNGKECKIIVNNNFLKDIQNDNRNIITIYYKLDYNTLLDFFEKCKHINKSIIVISGCSDHPITKNIFTTKPNNIKKWYGENVNYIDNNLIPLPGGTLSGTWIGNNKFDAELYNHEDFKLVKINELPPKIINLAFMCFSNNNPHRNNVYNYFDSKNWVSNLCSHKTGKYLNDNIFMDMVYNHHFVISPFGNGIDCGRTWMALQLGSIPIMPYHICFEDWAKNLPIILYHDINEITETYLVQKLYEFKHKKYNYDYLKTSYWKNRWDNDKLNFNQSI